MNAIKATCLKLWTALRNQWQKEAREHPILFFHDACSGDFYLPENYLRDHFHPSAAQIAQQHGIKTPPDNESHC